MENLEMKEVITKKKKFTEYTLEQNRDRIIELEDYLQKLCYVDTR